MTGRPGLLAATIFAFGALFGLVASSVLLGMDANRVRGAVEERAAEQPGPLADLLFARMDEREVFDDMATAVRAEQVRNLQVATFLTALATVGVGAAFRRRSTDVAEEVAVGDDRVSDRSPSG